MSGYDFILQAYFTRSNPDQHLVSPPYFKEECLKNEGEMV